MTRSSWMKVIGLSLLPLAGMLARKKVQDDKEIFSQDVGKYTVHIHRK